VTDNWEKAVEIARQNYADIIDIKSWLYRVGLHRQKISAFLMTNPDLIRKDCAKDDKSIK